jgi:hypothetical protein
VTDVSWLVPVSALVGAGMGASLSYLGARAGVRANDRATDQRETAARREEWGRRFATALSLLGEPDLRERRIGRALLAQLLDSELATVEDRHTAAEILATEALPEPTQAALRALPASPDLDDVRFVQDNNDEADALAEDLTGGQS